MVGNARPSDDQVSCITPSSDPADHASLAPGLGICHMGQAHSQTESVRDDSMIEGTTWTPLGSTPFPAKQPLRQGHPPRTGGLPERTATRTSRRYLAAALAAEKRWARAALGAIGDAVLTIDLRGTVTYMNRVAETLTGWSQRHAIGRLRPGLRAGPPGWQQASDRGFCGAHSRPKGSRHRRRDRVP